MRAMILFLQRVLQSCAAVREWKTNDAAEQSSSQMEYIPGKDGMLHGAEQFLDRIDSWKRWDAAEQSSSWKRHDAAEHCSSWKRQDAAQSRAVPGQNRFVEKTGCYLAEKVVEQSNMLKGEKNSFTFFNMFFSYKNGSEILCTVC